MIFQLCLVSFLINLCHSQFAVGVASFTNARGGSSTITGTIKFTQPALNDPIRVDVDISGLTTGSSPNNLHGIHIHAYGDLRGYLPNAGSSISGALSAGPHYDPLGTDFHSCQEVASPFTAYHMGDLGNWNRSASGTIKQSKLFTTLRLTGANSIIGRTVVIHGGEDDCLTPPAGNSGPRVAAAVIGIANLASNNANSQNSGQTGICVLQGTSNAPAALGDAGTIIFTESTTPRRISVKARIVTGDTNEHGFHVHTYGDLTAADGSSLGPHLNPDGQLHSLPGVSPNRHLGDFGSIRAYDGNGNGYYDYAISDYTPAASLELDNFIGRGVVIHETLDHGNEPTCAGSENNGAAGSRWFTCVIGVVNPNTDAGANFLEVPQPPAGINIDNTWSNVPCSFPTRAPTTSLSTSAPTNVYEGLSGGAVVGILIALFFVLIVIAICITCILVKVVCK